MVWNVGDPYFMDRKAAWKVNEQMTEKVTELVKSMEVQSTSQTQTPNLRRFHDSLSFFK